MSVVVAAPRQSRKRARTRGELVAAAERLVALRGLDALSIDEITEEADVAKGTFYTHFHDKDDLANAIAGQIRMELETRIAQLNDGITDAKVRMTNGLSTVLSFAIRQPVRARALIRLIPSAADPDMPINTGIRNDITLGIDAGVFLVPSVSAAVVATIGSAMSALIRLSQPGRPVDDPHGLATQVIEIALAGLGVERREAQRLSRAAMNSRRKETET
jgi:AcrR family transcriptional regulator